MEWKLGAVFEATNVQTGIRSRFRAVEHFNIGEGWMCLDLDHKHRGIVASQDLVDLADAPA